MPTYCSFNTAARLFYLDMWFGHRVQFYSAVRSFSDYIGEFLAKKYYLTASTCYSGTYVLEYTCML